MYYTVTLRIWFDERTISAGRGNGPLRPGPRRAVVVDYLGREFAPVATSFGATLDRPLRPGEAYTAELSFDLPSDARNPRLLVTDAAPVSRWLIGHERSWLHKKVTFPLEPAASALL